MSTQHVAIAGAGLAGSTLARILAENGFTVSLFEARSHIAGNCYDSRCSDTGIMIHRYGPHIFHTEDKEVRDFLCRFTSFSAYTHKVRTIAQDRVWSLPVNLLTLNQLWGSTLAPQEAQQKIESLRIPCHGEAKNLEQQALSLMGKQLYEMFFKHYSEKQWGCAATELPASILTRLPFRFDYDDRYFRQRWQGIPAQGYTEMVTRMLAHPAITLHLNTPCTAEMCESLRREGIHLFWTGPLDAWFNYKAGHLPYRTLDFEAFTAEGDWQGCAVMNYGDAGIPWTRITEHKHFMPDEQHAKTVCWREYSREAEPGDNPYYPIRLTDRNPVLTRYLSEARFLSGVTFLGRLATFRYQDMDAVVRDALDIGRQVISGHYPLFPEGII